MTVNQRIKILIESEKDKGITLHKHIGVGSGTLGNITGERKSKPGFKVIQAILKKYRNLNPYWLILGEGEMWLSQENAKSDTVEMSKSDIQEIRSLLREVFERMDKQDELIEELKNQMD